MASLLALALAAVVLVSPARADRLYWTNFDGPKPLTYADLEGGAVSELSIAPVVPSVPNGVAIDPAGGRIYFANSTKDQIAYANLDGSGGGILNTTGATMELPIAVAIDPAAGRVYWTNEDGDKISFAKLDGSGGGDLNTAGATVKEPNAITVDPAEGRVYWANGTNPGSFGYAALNGTGGADLPITGSATVKYPLGLAIDQAAHRIYWTNDENGGPISFANLDGSGSHDLNTTGAKLVSPYGIAVDPESGKVYWGNTSAESIGTARTDGSGGATMPLAIPKGSAPNFPVIYKTPRFTAAPTVRRTNLLARPKSRGRRGTASRLVGAKLDCSAGSWAPDLVESFLYRAPLTTSRQWIINGTPLTGSDGETLRTGVIGNYTCRETASNWAGAKTSESPVVAVFKVGAAKIDIRTGTARLPIAIPPGSRLTASGKSIVALARKKAGQGFLRIRAKGKARRTLDRTGTVKVKARLALAESENQFAKVTIPVTLREGRAH